MPTRSPSAEGLPEGQDLPGEAKKRRRVCTRVTPGEPLLQIGGSAQLGCGERTAPVRTPTNAGIAVPAESCGHHRVARVLCLQPGERHLGRNPTPDGPPHRVDAGLGLRLAGSQSGHARRVEELLHAFRREVGEPHNSRATTDTLHTRTTLFLYDTIAHGEVRGLGGSRGPVSDADEEADGSTWDYFLHTLGRPYGAAYGNLGCCARSLTRGETELAW